MKHLITVLGLLAFFATAAIAADSLSALQAKAEHGDAAAALSIGRMYASGKGVAQDNYEAAFWMSVSLRMEQDITRKMKIVDEIEPVTKALSEQQRKDLYTNVIDWGHAHPDAIPLPAAGETSAAEGAAAGIFLVLLGLFGFGFFPWVIFRVRRWFQRHQSLVPGQLPEKLRKEYALLRAMLYICCALPILPLVHFRLWTFAVTLVFFFVTWLLKRKLEPALLEAGKKSVAAKAG